MQWPLVCSVILFIISFMSVILENLSKPIPFLSIFPELINSSSGFLSVLCLIAVFAVFRKYKEDKEKILLPNCFYILDMMIINKLYLNETWQAVFEWLKGIWGLVKDWNWPIIAIMILILAIAAGIIICFFLLIKRSLDKKGTPTKKKDSATKSYQRREPDNNRNNFKPASSKMMTESADSQNNMQTGEPPESSKEPDDLQNGRQTEEPLKMPNLVYVLVCLFLIIPVVSFVQFIFYRVLPLNLAPPEYLSNSLDAGVFISTICIGIIAALFLWLAKINAINEGKKWELRRPAVLALFAEMLIFFLFFFRADLVSEDFLNSFLSVVVNNTLIAVIVIPIVLFVVLDIGISLFINIFFGDISTDSKDWKEDAQKKIDEIQRRIVMFVLNIFIGILNLFLFIPDFFNEIGGILLSRDNLFPEYKKEDKNRKTDTDKETDTNKL